MNELEFLQAVGGYAVTACRRNFENPVIQEVAHQEARKDVDAIIYIYSEELITTDEAMQWIFQTAKKKSLVEF